MLTELLEESSEDIEIAVAGKSIDDHGYVFGDYTIHDIPQKWAKAVITAYNRHEANVIGETNNGAILWRGT